MRKLSEQVQKHTHMPPPHSSHHSWRRQQWRRARREEQVGRPGRPGKQGRWAGRVGGGERGAHRPTASTAPGRAGRTGHPHRRPERRRGYGAQREREAAQGRQAQRVGRVDDWQRFGGRPSVQRGGRREATTTTQKGLCRRHGRRGGRRGRSRDRLLNPAGQRVSSRRGPRQPRRPRRGRYPVAGGARSPTPPPLLRPPHLGRPEQRVQAHLARQWGGRHRPGGRLARRRA
jgi:hypothetical protein